MSLVSINWHPKKPELRKFGIVMLIGFGLIGSAFMLWPWSWPLTRSTNTALACWVFGGLAGILGLSGTRACLLVYLPWMAVAFVVGSVVGRVVVLTMFYVLITPMGLLMRLSGRDRLRLKKPQGATYWVDYSTDDAVDYERQF